MSVPPPMICDELSRPNWRRFASWLTYTILLVVLLAVGTVWGWLGSTPVGVSAIRQIVTNTPPREVFDGKSSLTLLILGCDEDRYYGGKQILRAQARSDMMLVAKFDFEQNRISGVSIPRDTLVRVPGYSSQRINAYHAIGSRKSPEQGKELSKRAVQELLGPIDIDRVVVLNFEAFQEMVDLVGGVPIYVPKTMKYVDRRGGVDIDFEPGRTVLNGYDAMMFVRFRKGDDDFQRQKRQKEFMFAFKDQLMSNANLLPRVADKAVKAMGGALSADEVVAAARFAQRVGHDNIRFGVVPVVDAGNYDLKVDERRLDQTLQQFYLQEPSQVSSLP
jgi:LCP family protein required for cell wall assembly